ncbi:hypothetical protein L3V83_14985 [Thiotrichales bacterium 19X7-9]|nr:hypothetical protein [Thiotrichales bacterium 19X7-9]
MKFKNSILLLTLGLCTSMANASTHNKAFFYISNQTNQKVYLHLVNLPAPPGYTSGYTNNGKDTNQHFYFGADGKSAGTFCPKSGGCDHASSMPYADVSDYDTAIKYSIEAHNSVNKYDGVAVAFEYKESDDKVGVAAVCYYVAPSGNSDDSPNRIGCLQVEKCYGTGSSGSISGNPTYYNGYSSQKPYDNVGSGKEPVITSCVYSHYMARSSGGNGNPEIYVMHN